MATLAVRQQYLTRNLSNDRQRCKGDADQFPTHDAISYSVNTMPFQKQITFVIVMLLLLSSHLSCTQHDVERQQSPRSDLVHEPVFDGDSAKLHATSVVVTLAHPTPQKKQRHLVRIILNWQIWGKYGTGNVEERKTLSSSSLRIE